LFDEKQFLVDHDCVIGNVGHLSLSVELARDVIVVEGIHIGVGAYVIQGIKIGKWATFGSGAVVLKNVLGFAVLVGNPGRIIKYN
jgi:acetyltransferase-like isoleucine patch superfamily enzyme